MRLARYITALTLSFVVALVFALPALAAPYGGGTYGDCPYQTSCPAPTPPPANEPDPDPGVPVVDANTDPHVVSIDIDNDGNLEQATDTDNNPANGYEQYSDPDGSSHVIAKTDGEHNGTTGYLVDTNNDGTPDVYWSPDNDYKAPVEVQVQGDRTTWAYVNSKGETQYYYPPQKSNSGSGGGTSAPKPPSSSGAQQPAEHRITGNGFGGAAYEKVGTFVKQVPAPVAYSFPYLLLLLVVLLIWRLIWQTKGEIARLRAALANIEREKALVLEKQNFLMLASHYLRTPLTAIKGYIELLQSLKKIPDAVAVQLGAGAAGMQNEANTLLATLEQNKNLEQITVSQSRRETWLHSLRSPFIIMPLIGIFLGVFIANFLFADFRVTRPGAVDILVQLALAAILVQWLLSTLRRRHLNRQNRLEQQRVLDAQRELDTARSNFIKGATEGLSVQIANFERLVASVAQTGVDTARIEKGVASLKTVTDRFIFATQLQALAVQGSNQPFNSAFVVQSAIGENQQKASDKKILLDSQAQGGKITQNQALLTNVLNSLVDNAIKYSNEQGTVQLTQSMDGTGAKFKVVDQGKGLSEEQLITLFKPFSRAESAETFNSEGLGFSLYLDRLVMHYLGGDITINSELGKGTQAELVVPSA